MSCLQPPRVSRRLSEDPRDSLAALQGLTETDWGYLALFDAPLIALRVSEWLQGLPWARWCLSSRFLWACKIYKSTSRRSLRTQECHREFPGAQSEIL